MNNADSTQDQMLTRLVTGIRSEDPTPKEERAAVDRLRRRLGSRLVPGPSEAQPSHRARILAAPTRWRRPMLRLGIAAAVVGSVTLWQWMPTAPMGAGVAFGQVLDSVRQATSMSYTLIEELPGGGEDVVQVQIQSSRWLRLVSAGKGIRIVDLQDLMLLHFDHPQGPAKQAVHLTFVGLAAQALQSAAGPYTELKELLPGDGEPLGRKMIDGQELTGFRIRRQSPVHDPEDQSVWEIWADSETAQVVRVDIQHERDNLRITLVDFTFDVEFDDSLFALQPPPGYTVAHKTIKSIEFGGGK